MDCTVALSLLYLVVPYSLLMFKLRSYRTKPYSAAQVGLVYNTAGTLLAAIHQTMS